MLTSVRLVSVNYGDKDIDGWISYAICDTPETADQIIQIWAKQNGVEIAPVDKQHTAYRFADSTSNKDYLAAHTNHYVVLTANDIQDGKIVLDRKLFP